MPVFRGTSFFKLYSLDMKTVALFLTFVNCFAFEYSRSRYIAKEHEKLEQIVRRYSGLTGYELVAEVGRIAYINHISNIHEIFPGQEIILIKNSDLSVNKIINPVTNTVPKKLKKNHRFQIIYGMSKTDSEMSVDSVNRKIILNKKYQTEGRFIYMYSPDNSYFSFGGYAGDSNSFGISIGVDF
ncbi:MAG: hypothetical protein H6622_13370 [Halobacteriovoraceae bacterium]|nr:hypothetical protein [Halobacteriovoraceae bacterium]